MLGLFPLIFIIVSIFDKMSSFMVTLWTSLWIKVLTFSYITSSDIYLIVYIALSKTDAFLSCYALKKYSLGLKNALYCSRYEFLAFGS